MGLTFRNFDFELGEVKPQREKFYGVYFTGGKGGSISMLHFFA